jgi:DNA primase
MTNCPLSSNHDKGSDRHPSLIVFCEKDPTICFCHSCKYKGSLYNLAKTAGASHDVLEYIDGAEGKDIFKRAKHLPRYDVIPDALRHLDRRVIMKNDAIRNRMKNGEGWYFYGRPGIDEYRLTDDQKNEIDRWIACPTPSYFIERGVTQDQIKKWTLGFDPQGIVGDIRSSKTADGSRSEFFYSHGERVVFVVKSEKGEAVGWSKRSIHQKEEKFWVKSGFRGKNVFVVRGEPKYYHCPGFQRDYYLYGMHLIDAHRSKTAIIVEGFFDVLNIDRFGILNPLAVMGSSISEKQLRFLIDNFKNVIFLPDGDKAGIDFAKQGFDKLKPFVNVKIAGWIDGKDPGDYSEQDLRQLLSQRFQISLLNKDVHV